MAKEGKTDRFHDKFPTRLRGLIEEKGVTQVALASLLGISRQSFSAYCDGSTQPNIENTIKMANYFGVSVDYLFGLSDIRATDPATKSLCESLGLTDEAVHAIQNDEAIRKVVSFFIAQHLITEKTHAQRGGYNARLWEDVSLVGVMADFLNICSYTSDASLDVLDGKIFAEIYDGDKVITTELSTANNDKPSSGGSISLFRFSAKEGLDSLNMILTDYMEYKYQKNIGSPLWNTAAKRGIFRTVLKSDEES